MRKRREMVLPILLLGLAPLGACEQVDGDATPIDPGAVEGILEILPREVTLTAIGDTARLNAALKTTSGHRVEPSGAVEWSVTNPQVATVSSDGRVSAKGTGKTAVRGKVGQQVDSVIVVVTQKPSRVDASPETSTLTALGSTTQLEAQVFDANGTPISGASISWYSTDPSIAEVSGSGKVVARAEGSTRIVASAVGASPDTVTVNVAPKPVKITISPASARMRVGEALQLTATATDANGNPADVSGLTWTSLNTEIASVSAAGRVTAIAAGTALITASAICCTAADTAELIVEPDDPSGNVAPFFADNFDNGRLNSANGFVWSSSSNRVSADQAYSGSYSMKLSFGPTEPDGDPHWWSEQRFDFGKNLTEVWIEFMFRLPDNYIHQNPGGPTNNKFIAIWAENYSTAEDFQVITEFERVSNTQSRARSIVRDEKFPAGEMSGYSNNNFLNTSWAGKWRRVRIHIRVDSGPNTRDGVYEGWIDDTLMWRSGANQAHWTSAGAARNYLRRGYLMGYDNSRYPQPTHFYIDDFKVYDRDPGWK